MSPIFIDESENRSTSNMPVVEGSISVTGMEEICGADAMVSTLKIPPRTKTLIQKHADSGALFIQIKRGGDLPSSIGDRLNLSLAKMFEVKTKFAGQRILLVTGLFCYDKDGKVLVGNVVNTSGKSPYVKWYDAYGGSWKALITAVRMWALRGGVNIISLPIAGNISDWLHGAERDLESFKEKPFKDIIAHTDFPDDPPEPKDILQLPRRVTDFRRVLAACPGIGPARANILWEAANHDPITAILYLLEKRDVVKGIGDKTIASNREFWGMGEGMELIQRYKENYTLEELLDGVTPENVHPEIPVSYIKSKSGEPDKGPPPF